MNIEKLANLLRENGVVGAGGAGFPSYAKLNSKADTIILNCAECEPVLKLHRQVLEKYAFEVVSAFSEIAEAVGAEKAIIAVKKSYKGAVEAVKAVLKDFNKIEIKYLPEVYPSGDEVFTTYETTGRVVPPGNIPISVGVTLFNVETVYNIYQAIHNNKPVTHKFITVAGEVKNPKTVYVPLGMTFKDVIDLAGGINISEYALINGGPMMGSEAGIYDTVTKTTNAILVLPKTHYIIERKNAKNKINMKRAMSACCQCRMCTDLCPRYLLGHPIVPSEFMHAASSGTVRDIKPMIDTAFCSSCGLCELYSCGQGLSPRTLITEYKTELKKQGIVPDKNTEMAPVSRMRKYRGVSKERLTARIGLSKYETPAPLEMTDVKADEYKINLSQHIGAPAVADVKVGDKIKKYQVIGKAKEDALSVNIHSPADGEVIAVNERQITIRQEDEK